MLIYHTAYMIIFSHFVALAPYLTRHGICYVLLSCLPYLFPTLLLSFISLLLDESFFATQFGSLVFSSHNNVVMRKNKGLC